MSSPVFISYCRDDLDFTLKLISDLRERHVDVWFDANIRGGEAWANAVENALQTSGIVLVILSPKSRSSREVSNEIAYALNHGKRIIPVIYQKCDVPMRLSSLNRHDLTENYHEALDRLVADIQGEPIPGPVPVQHRWCQKPRNLVYAGLFIALSAGGIYFAGNSIWGGDRSFSDTGSGRFDTIPIKPDTPKNNVHADTPSVPITRQLTGVFGGRNVNLLIIQEKGSVQITGTYFYTDQPAVQFVFTGTDQNDLLKLNQLSGGQISAKLVLAKTSVNCYNGTKTALPSNLQEELRLCRPRQRLPLERFRMYRENVSTFSR